MFNSKTVFPLDAEGDHIDRYLDLWRTGTTLLGTVDSVAVQYAALHHLSAGEYMLGVFDSEDTTLAVVRVTVPDYPDVETEVV